MVSNRIISRGLTSSRLTGLTLGAIGEGGDSPPESCALEEFQIFFDGSGQTTTLSGTNNSVITATSNGTINSESIMVALNTVFRANANPIVWLGEAVVTAQDIPPDTTNSRISFWLALIDVVAQSNIAGVEAVWRSGGDVNKLQDASDSTNLSDIDLSNGFKVGMYYDSVAGKVYAALDAETTFELTIQNAITPANNKLLLLNVYAGNIEDTSISVQFNQSGTDTIQAFPNAAPWCQAVYNE